VPISTLKVEPFVLPWGASVYAKVNAINVVGASDYSQVGNGAIILTIPDAPLNLSDDVLITSLHQIGLQWYQGYENGGTPVLDYRVWYREIGGTYQVLEETVTQSTYLATPMTTGTTY
jgi:hypothetical protein